MAAHVDNVTFYHTGGTGTYQCIQNPVFQIEFPEVKNTQTLDNGVNKVYHKEIVPVIQLSWSGDKFFRGIDRSGFRTIFNTQDEIIINLSPASAPGASFTVNWMSAFSFPPVQGATPFGFTGTILLEGARTITEIPDIPWASDGLPW